MSDKDEKLKQLMRPYIEKLCTELNETNPNKYSLILLAIRDFHGSSEVLDEIRNHPVIGKQIDVIHGTSKGGTLVQRYHIINRFLSDFLDPQEGFIFDEKKFEDSFSRMMQYFRSETVRGRIVVSLYHLSASDDKIALPNGWTIKKQVVEDKREWMSRFYYELQEPPRFILSRDFETERYFGKKPSREVEDTPIEDILEKEARSILCALHLLKSGRVFSRAIQYVPLDWSVGLMTGVQYRTDIPRGTLKTYDLFSEEVPLLIDLIEKLLHTELERGYDVAMRRLSYVVERGSTRRDDNILDLMIGLESFFLSGIDQELSYRFSLRSSVLLGDTLEERKVLHNQIRAAYGLRSSIIHGYSQGGIEKNLKKLDMSMSQVSDFIEELLRESLRRFLNHRVDGRSIKDVINVVDTALLDESKFSHSEDETL